MKRAALYLRVSTDEQTTENQRPELERLARTRGWRIVGRYNEVASGVRRRPMLERLVDLVQRGEVDVVAVWKLDRFGRSMPEIVRTVLELDDAGVELISVRDTWLNTSSPAVRKLLISVFAWFAEQEREVLVERTKAGLDRARAKGVRLGRPRRVAAYELPRLLSLRNDDGLSLRAIAARLKIPEPTVRRALKRAANGAAP